MMPKTILITGSTDGIGLQAAKVLYSQGHHILLHGRSDTKLKAAEKGANYITAPQCAISDSGDFTNNCYSTMICTASAFKAGDQDSSAF